MTTILTGLGYGFFGTIGFALAILTVVLLGVIIVEIKKARIRKKDLPRIILDYRKTLLKKDRFEEYALISKYVKQLKKSEMPKELQEKYELDIDSYFCWMDDGDGDGKLTYKYAYKLKPKAIFAPKKEEANKQDAKPEDKKSDKNESDSKSSDSAAE